MSFFVGQSYAQSAPDSNTPDGLIKIIVADVITSIKSDPEIEENCAPYRYATHHTVGDGQKLEQG